METRFLTAAALLGTSGAAIAQSGNSTNASPPPRPPHVATQPPVAAADMQAVLNPLPLLGAKPIETLTPVKARIQPSAADAAKAVMRSKGMSTTPDAAVTTQDLPYGSDPMQFARVYKPVAATGAPMPVIVYTARLAVAAESAGGNLAVATAIYARDNNLTMPLHILSVYPIANSSATLQQELVTELRAETGTARDDAYVAQQKASHGQALAVQKAYAMEGTAPALKSAAATIVPVVEQHVAMLKTM